MSARKREEQPLPYVAGLLDDSEDAIVALDAEWYITAWNAGAQRLYGWTADEVLGRHTLEVARLEMSHEERTDVRVAVAERGRWSGETIAYRNDGTPVWIELITVALRGAQGEIVGYLGIHRDAGARRRAETILESITDAFYALDRDWCLTYANERAVRFAAQLAGRELSRDEVLGQSLWTLLPRSVGSSIEDHCRRAMDEQRPVVFEYRYPGSEPWFEVHAYPSEHRLSIYFHEITDRKAAEQERERRAHQHAAVAELGLRALADDDTHELAREAASLIAVMLDVELAGLADRLPSGELLLTAGVGWVDGTLGAATGAAGAGSLLGYTLLVGEPVVSEDIDADARFTPSPPLKRHGVVSAVTAVVKGPQKHFGVLGAFSTRARRFSREDVTFVQSVANVVAGALRRADVEERVRDVREAERRRLARALHDGALQDLSLALARAARIAAGPSPTETAGAIVADLARVGEQLRGAIYDLRLGGEDHRPFPELLSELVAMHRASVSYDIVLELATGTPAHSLGATGIEVLRIVGEVLSNARRHAAPRRVTVRAGGSDAVLWCEVEDDGRGISPGGTPARHGTGIAGMKERAALISASLTIDGGPGAGTKVRMEVPLRERVSTAEGSIRVLLVEDHTAVRQALAGVFEQAGVRVVGQADSLAQAREMLRDVDVAVLDLALPDGFGADLIDDLRAASPAAHALALSASLDRGEIARAVDRGAAAVLPKSTPLDEIVRAVRRLRAGETLLPLDDVVDLLRLARREEDRRHDDLAAIAELTPREREVLQLLAEGLGAEQIATRLHIAHKTQRNHVASILAKLGVHSQLQAVIFAVRCGVVQVR